MSAPVSRLRRAAIALTVSLVAGVLATTGASPASAAAGAFQGTVTALAGGAGVPNAYVAAYDSAGAWAGSAYANGTGFYTIAGLAPGQYRVYFGPSFGENLVPEWYNDQATIAAANPITVTSGGLLGSVNASLDSGSTVQGTLTGNTGAVYLQNAYVSLYNATDLVGYASTNASGFWSIAGIRPGSYTIQFSGPSGYASKWWLTSASRRTATFFTVGSKVTVTNNANLPLENTIAGTVTGFQAGGLEATVVAYEANGSIDDLDSWVAQTYTEPGTGNYTLHQLPVGTYKVGFTTQSSGFSPTTGALMPGSDGYTSEWYSHAFSYTAASSVNLPSVGYHLVGVDMELYNPTFADVPQHTSSVYDAIEWAYDRGITTGTPQSGGKPLFKPLDAVSRQAMASFLYKMAGDTFTPPATPTFADVTSANPFYTAIEWMYASGISQGTAQAGGKPLYQPAAPVSRQSMAIFLARYAGTTLVNPGYQDFADVPSSAAAFTAIHFMADAGVSNGTAQPGGLPLYKPLDPVSRQSMALFLQRLESYLNT